MKRLTYEQMLELFCRVFNVRFHAPGVLGRLQQEDELVEHIDGLCELYYLKGKNDGIRQSNDRISQFLGG